MVLEKKETDSIEQYLPRYVHRSCRRRCSTTSACDTFIFGGETSAADRRQQSLCDLWRVRVNERKETVGMSLQRVTTEGRLSFAGGAAASAMTCLQGDLYIFGGTALSPSRERRFLNSTWRLCQTGENLWEAAPAPVFASSSTGRLPAPRWGHTLVSCFDEFMLLFGGSSPDATYCDLWLYSPVAGWRELLPAGGVGGRAIEDELIFQPSARAGHSATVLGEYMYLLGGNDRQVSYGDLWRLWLPPLRTRHAFFCGDALAAADCTAGEVGARQFLPLLWERVEPYCASVDGPSPSIGHCVVPLGSSLFVYGGRDFVNHRYQRGVYIYDTHRGKWSGRLCVSDEVADREEDPEYLRTGHCAVLCGTGLLYVGGMLPSGSTARSFLHLNIFGYAGRDTSTDEGVCRYKLVEDA